jgi:hypothetical protein
VQIADTSTGSEPTSPTASPSIGSTTGRRAVGALFLFHAAGGARVASRNAIATIGLIIIVLGSAPDPLLWLRFLALGVAAKGAAGGPLLGLAAIAYTIAREAIPRLTLGLGGWTRSLPADGVQHRRGVIAGMPIIQIPLAAAVLVSALLTVTLYHAPLSWPKLLGAPVALLAAGAAAVPARRRLLSLPCFTASTLLAAFGTWTALGMSVILFGVADRVAGPLRFALPRAAVPAPAIPGTLRMFRFTWRAIGWRLLAPLPVPLLALAAAWFYTRNNELPPADVGFVARLWTTIAMALYIGAVGDTIASRRPLWPWIRSLPWSSAQRAVDDAIAIGAPAVAIAIGSAIVDARSVVTALAILPPLAALGTLLLRGARGRLTRVSGGMFVVGTVLGTAIAFAPWMAAIALAATPLLLRWVAHRDRREIVTGWKELHHDASGDSLAWSSR